MKAGFQKSVWVNGAGDDWFKRNRSELGGRDLVEPAIESLKIAPKRVLEIGCADGWRLQRLKKKYGCSVTGIEPSTEARKKAHAAGLIVHDGTADKLDFPDSSFDMVIYGFCFCFISPEEWQRIVSEGDRVLADGGHIIIYDFIGTRFLKRRMMDITEDKSLEELPLYLYNFDWPQLWLWHPAYKVGVELFDLGKSEVCTVIHKGLSHLLTDEIRTAS